MIRVMIIIVVLTVSLMLIVNIVIKLSVSSLFPYSQCHYDHYHRYIIIIRLVSRYKGENVLIRRQNKNNFHLSINSPLVALIYL